MKCVEMHHVTMNTLLLIFWKSRVLFLQNLTYVIWAVNMFTISGKRKSNSQSISTMTDRHRGNKRQRNACQQRVTGLQEDEGRETVW